MESNLLNVTVIVETVLQYLLGWNSGNSSCRFFSVKTTFFLCVYVYFHVNYTAKHNSFFFTVYQKNLPFGTGTESHVTVPLSEVNGARPYRFCYQRSSLHIVVLNIFEKLHLNPQFSVEPSSSKEIVPMKPRHSPLPLTTMLCKHLQFWQWLFHLVALITD